MDQSRSHVISSYLGLNLASCQVSYLALRLVGLATRYHFCFPQLYKVALHLRTKIQMQGGQSETFLKWHYYWIAEPVRAINIALKQSLHFFASEFDQKLKASPVAGKTQRLTNILPHLSLLDAYVSYFYSYLVVYSRDILI